ncbi:MAG: MBOAT family protein [Clostridiales bacterium]|nr:MBOAT family protein [Clostridiales bacterium]
MAFTSVCFFFFFPVVCLAYWMISPQHVRLKKHLLLFSSCAFFLFAGVFSFLTALLVTLVSYGCGIGLRNIRADGQARFFGMKKQTAEKALLAAGCVTVLLTLAFIKYYDFGAYLWDRAFALLGVSAALPRWNILVPLGLSFYSLQAVGYLADVYRGKILCESNFLDYALFVLYFPQVFSGPIGRAGSLLPQFEKPRRADPEVLRTGLIWMAWGYFLKLVVADRLAVFVDTFYSSPAEYPGLASWVAVFFYAMQIYCDFSGYSLIALGCSKAFGIDLINNFRMPYFSRSMKEFWSRWHISLSTWFRDYLYFPLGGSRCSSRKRDRNLMIVFAASGLWHGASLTFLLWGALHGFYQVAEKRLAGHAEKLRSALGLGRLPAAVRSAFQIALTFLLAALAWIPFRADSFRTIPVVLKNLVTPVFWPVKDGYYGFGLNKAEFLLCLFGIAAVFTVDLLREKGWRPAEILYRQNTFVRFACYAGLVIFILLFGVYGPGFAAQSFIYGQF